MMTCFPPPEHSLLTSKPESLQSSLTAALDPCQPCTSCCSALPVHCVAAAQGLPEGLKG